MGGEADITFLSQGGAIDGPAVQLCQCLSRGVAIAYLVQDADERGILLAIDMLQLNGHVVYLLQGLRTEEIGRVVVGFQHAFVLRRHHRRQLCQVANHQQLYTAKGLIMFTEATQHRINSIEQIGTYHGDFVDDEEVHRSDNLTLLTAKVELALHLGSRHVGRERQLEERVDGDATRIDGRHTCGCHDYGALARLLHHRLQERCLARSCLACQKDAASRVLHEVPRRVQLAVLFHHSLVLMERELFCNNL